MPDIQAWQDSLAARGAQYPPMVKREAHASFAKAGRSAPPHWRDVSGTGEVGNVRPPKNTRMDGVGFGDMTAPLFADKVAVITGASGGIGDAIGRAFVDAGASVICADRQKPPEDSGMLFYQTDVGDEASIASLFAFAEERCGGVDVLVSCAGMVLEKPVLQTSAAEWDLMMAVNARGVFLSAKHAAMTMKKRGGGAIVNIGSIEAMGANPSHAVYAASKGAVHSLTRNLALELGAYNIRCNAVAPGWIDTPFNDNLLAQYPNPAAAREAVNALHPLGKSGKPEDVAKVVLWLASDNAAFVNGQVYIIDGGRTAILPLPPL